MKNLQCFLYSILMLIFLANPAFSQDLSLSFESANIDIGGHIDYNELQLTNNGSETLEIALRLNKICYSDLDDNMITICFGEFCFAGTNQETTEWGTGDDVVLYLGPNESSGQFKLSQSSDANMASSWEVIFFDKNNIDNNVKLQVTIGDCSATSTKDVVETLRPAFPNPASGKITLPLNGSTNSQLTIVNAAGATLNTIQLDRYAENAQVDISKYNEGVYFYYVTKEDGTRTRAATFLKH